mmetsp:Transcript_13305/g.22596  ORF Transcript_13305/g.22596 Transcript_13305/m.22596 type:complete len:99 (+) Transcript_13305:772-1068(+)
MRSFYQKVGVSFGASFALSLFLYPLDTIKRNMQLNGGRGFQKNFNSYQQCFSYLIESRMGARGLYAGVGIFAFREFLSVLVQVELYDYLAYCLPARRE